MNQPLKFYRVIDISRKIYLWLFTALLVVCVQTSWAQDEDEPKGFHGLKKSADGASKAGEYHSAVGYLDKMSELKPEHYKTHLKLARNSVQIRDYATALEAYMVCYDIDRDKTPELLFEIATARKNLGLYDEAKTSFKTFINKYGRDADLKPLKKSAEAGVLSCDSAKLLMEKQLNVEIQRFPNSINGPHIEFNPFYIGSDQLVYGALKETEVKKYDKDSIAPVRNFYYAKIVDDIWEDQGVWNSEINTSLENTGNGSFNADSSLFFFSKCAEDWRGKMICTIYQADYANGKISGAKKLGENVNALGSSNSQPAVGYESRMGRMLLFFVSDREGGRGGKDIWVSQYDAKKDKFKSAKNLGRKLNSEFDEMTPYLDETRKKMYFSSNHVRGLGGFDVYEVRGENRKWGLPKNVGYPINTNADEIYFKVNELGDAGLFTSNRSGSSQMFHPTCCDDIYKFSFRDYVILALDGEIVEVSEEDYIQGKGDTISDTDTLTKITNADISIYLIEDGEEVLMKELQSSSDGEYFLQLEEGQDYRIEVSKNSYYSNFLEVSTKDRTYSDTLTMNVGLAKIGAGSIIIPDIYYDFDSAELTAESRGKIMSTLYQVLIENPKFRIELSSHTDSRGADDYNMRLSQERAESVVKFLVENGISSSRLEPKGYGETMPVAPNENKDGSDNPEGRQLNRRTEFKLLDQNTGTF